jgi:hypothetical protein
MEAVAVAGNMRRLLESVGLERRARDVSPTLGDLLRHDRKARHEGVQEARLNRRVCIRIVRLERSENDVLMCLGSGLPSIRSLRAPMHSAGL